MPQPLRSPIPVAKQRYPCAESVRFVREQREARGRSGAGIGRARAKDRDFPARPPDPRHGGKMPRNSL